MKPTYRIAEISFGTSRWDSSYSFDYRGKTFEVQRFGANFSIQAMESLIKRFRHRVDAFAITSLPTEIRVANRTYIHPQTLEILSTPSSVPLCNGSSVLELSNVEGLSRGIADGVIRPERGIFFPIGLMHLECVHYLQEKHRDRLYFGDAYNITGIPAVAKLGSLFAHFAHASVNIGTMLDLKHFAPRPLCKISKMTRSAMLSLTTNMQYVLADPATLNLFESDLAFVRDKDVILTYNHPAMEAEIRRHSPRSIIPLMSPKFRSLSPCLSHSVLDAVLRLSLNRTAALSLEEWQDVLSAEAGISQHTRRYVHGARPVTPSRVVSQARRMRAALTREDKPDFAFIIHSLSYGHIMKAPGFKILRHAPKEWNRAIERGVAKLPPIIYGRCKNIVSRKNGREITGIIYGLFATPRVMREEPPEVTYKKIEKVCFDAAERGAKIVGLGAYTKIVGDAGSTINRNSPIPVTTGNSLSSSATLWALYDVTRRMGLLSVCKDTGRVDGTAAVIGATGSIGRVSAKLLASAYKRLVLIAPRAERLVELREEILKLVPSCDVRISTEANEFASTFDVLVTATSAFDQKIVDIERLKPGAVVCDCSRPLDFSPEDAMKRPDVLIIESGEVVLPGSHPQFDCDLGLPGDDVYACLGETAVLAMEGLYEPFTLGREIELEKVKRIYKLARAHGVELAAIRGHSGMVTDKEIALVKQLALAKRREHGTARVILTDERQSTALDMQG